MTALVRHRDLTPWITSHGATNHPNATFWLGQALSGLRTVRRQLKRAEEDRPGSAVGALASVAEIVALLETRYPSAAFGED